jgi:hypothetical protein
MQMAKPLVTENTVQLFSEDQQIFRANLLARFKVIMSKNYLKFLDHATGGVCRQTILMKNGFYEIRDLP